MLNTYLANARGTYFEYREMGMDHQMALDETVVVMLDMMQLRFDFALQMYRSHRTEIDAYAGGGVPVNEVNQQFTPEVAFLLAMRSSLSRMLYDYLNRDDPFEHDLLLRVYPHKIEVVSWDS